MCIVSRHQNARESETTRKRRPYQGNIAQVLIVDCEAFSLALSGVYVRSRENHGQNGFWRDDAERSNL